MKTYISGKITGLPIDEVVKKFLTAETNLKAIGHEVVNPITLAYELDRIMIGTDERFPALSRETYLKYSIQRMLDCEAVYFLKNWHISKGAVLEYQIAKECKLHLLFED